MMQDFESVFMDFYQYLPESSNMNESIKIDVFSWQ